MEIARTQDARRDARACAVRGLSLYFRLVEPTQTHEGAKRTCAAPRRADGSDAESGDVRPGVKRRAAKGAVKKRKAGQKTWS